MTRFLSFIVLIFSVSIFMGCSNVDNTRTTDTPEYFSLRPDVEKAYGYTHAVKSAATLKYPEQ